MTPRIRRIAAFTLLEVMIAIGILSVGLTAIFSSEGQAIKVAHRARQLNIATLLARCKMEEIEEQVLRDGMPAVDDSGRDECCEGAEVDGFTCEWEISRVVLPDETEAYSDEEEGGGGGGGGGGDPLGGIIGDEGSQTAALDGMLSGAGMGGFGGGDAFTEMAIGIAFPVLKPAIEEQVRRASVTISWGEGETSSHSFDVVQFLVAEQPPAVP